MRLNLASEELQIPTVREREEVQRERHAMCVSLFCGKRRNFMQCCNLGRAGGGVAPQGEERSRDEAIR